MNFRQIQLILFKLKKQSNEIFDLKFFHHLNQPGPLTNGLKFWLSFRRVIRIFMNLPGVWYYAESISLGYHTPVSQMTFLDPI